MDCRTDLKVDDLAVVLLLGGSKVKWGQVEGLANAVADMRVEEEGHASGAQVAISVPLPVGRVNLRVSPKVTDPLNVHYNQLVARALKGKVAERLQK